MSSKTKQTIRSVQISKAKSSLNSLVKRVHRDHEYLILKDNGTPLAAVMDIDEFEDYLELNDPKVRRDIEQSTKEFREGKGRPAREFLAELEAEATQARKLHRATKGGNFLACVASASSSAKNSRAGRPFPSRNSL